MKLSRLLVSVILIGALVGAAYVGQATESAGARMARAAQEFLDRLNPEQRARAAFAFESRERTNWNFVPLQDRNGKPLRKGLPLEAMTAEQRQAALELLAAGVSAAGKKEALAIMSLEAVLRDLEKGGSLVRNPDWYFVSIFGKPSARLKWGWRIEGHHLSLNFTMEDGQVASATPAFFGANPATVKDGPRRGQRTLAEAEDLARDLFTALDADQKKVALQKDQFPEIRSGSPDPGVGPARGLPASRMTQPQRDLLLRLMQSYTQRLPLKVAEAEMAQVKEGGFDQVHFAFAGGTQPGQPHTYRIQGPRFVVEFLNVQPDGARYPANHIHSVWRHLPGDF